MFRKLSLLGLSLILSLSFISTADAAPRINRLVDAIESTLKTDVSMDGSAKLNYGRTHVNVDTSYAQDRVRGGNILFSEDNKIYVHFEGSDFDDDEEINGLVFDGEGRIITTGSLDDQHYVMHIDSMQWDLEHPDYLTQEIFMGFTEMMKHLIGKTYDLDVAAIYNRITQAAVETGEITDRDFQDFENFFRMFNSQKELIEGAHELANILLDSGLFKVEEAGDTFIIRLADEPQVTDIKRLLKGILKYAFLIPELQDVALEEIEAMTDADIIDARQESREAFAEIKDLIDLEWQLQVTAGKIARSDFALKIDFPSFPYADRFAKVLTITSNATMGYELQTVVMPVVTRDDISLTAFFNAIVASYVQSAKQWAEWESEWEAENADYYNQPALEYTPLEVDYDESYYANDVFYVNEFLGLDALNTPLSSGNNTTMFELVVILEGFIGQFEAELDKHSGAYIYPSGYLCDTGNHIFDAAVSRVYSRINEGDPSSCAPLQPQLMIRRGRGVHMIVRSLFPEVRNPVQFAVNNGFISSTYVQGLNEVKKMTHGEFAQILSNIISYLSVG